MFSNQRVSPHIEDKRGSDTVSYDKFFAEVQKRTGTASRDDLERTIATTLELLGQRLRTVDAEAVAAQLPLPLRDQLSGSTEPTELSVDDFMRQLRQRVRRDRALEHAQVICRVLAETLNEQARAHLRMHALAPLFR
jgi:uncharacterized protein (DUF2267 family)